MPVYVIKARHEYFFAVWTVGLISAVHCVWWWVEFVSTPLWKHFTWYWLSASYWTNFFSKLFIFFHTLIYILTYLEDESILFIFYMTTMVSGYYYTTLYWLGPAFFIVSTIKEDTIATKDAVFMVANMLLGMVSAIAMSWV